ncbi:hypothetical protein [Variovorax paradoxus]|uniref:Uncharacterized protein n=1 Tax=Variovorax paradoxus (strain EPS) TaxID=595537 RepID=E6V3R4_VARPE|nr:hypothetical protein [Variovorax paradoxus]ADU36938.1 hypothetical protein Varpa_2740 [Variovorax paradoxus EPS]
MASKYKKGQLAYEFVAVPKAILLSPEWQALPPNAVRLALDLMVHYTGKNNGRLCPAFVVMQRQGWRSETTLIKAKRALLECSFVVHTRQGHAPHTTDWIAFTWWRLDWEKSMDIEPRGFPHLNFVKLSAPEKTHPALQKLEPLPTKQASRPAVSVGLTTAKGTP